MRACDSGRGGTCAQSGKQGEVRQVLGSFEEFSMAAAEMPALGGGRVGVAAGEVGRGARPCHNGCCTPRTGI